MLSCETSALVRNSARSASRSTWTKNSSLHFCPPPPPPTLRVGGPKNFYAFGSYIGHVFASCGVLSPQGLCTFALFGVWSQQTTGICMCVFFKVWLCKGPSIYYVRIEGGRGSSAMCTPMYRCQWRHNFCVQGRWVDLKSGDLCVRKRWLAPNGICRQ